MGNGAGPGVPSALPAPEGRAEPLALTWMRRHEERKGLQEEEDEEEVSEPRQCAATWPLMALSPPQAPLMVLCPLALLAVGRGFVQLR